MMNISPDLTHPLINSFSDIQFADLFEIEKIQNLQDLFAEAHGVASVITHPDGTPITSPSNFTRLCFDIIRKTEKGCANCFKSDAMIGRHNPSGPIVQPCLSGGLWDAGASITVGGKHIANWLIGQVRTEEVDEQYMIKYAEEIGADLNDFRKALNQVPEMSVEQFNKVSKMLFAFANELSEKAYNNLQLKIQITERERATVMLQESEVRFQMLFNEAPLGYQSLDVDGNFIEVNQQWLDTLGYKRIEVLGKWFGDFLSPAYQDGFRKRFPIFKAQGHIHSEFEMVHKNGEILFIAFEGKIGYNLNGEFKQTHCILQDITKRKQAEEALLESEKTYRMLFESISDAVFISELTEDGKSSRFIRVNDIACQRLGYNQDELLSKTSFEINSDRMKPVIALLMQSIIGKEHAIIETEHVAKDGRVIPVEISTRITKINNKTYFHSIARDITERKQIEEALIESEKHLKESQKVAHLGSYVWNLTTGLWHSSEILDEIFGIDENYVRTLDGWTNIIHPLWQVKLSDYVINDVVGKRQKFDKEYKIIRQNDGQERWVQGMGELEFDKDNQPIALVGTISDITERKTNEENLQNSEQMLQTVLDNFPGVVFWKDARLNYLGCNLAFAKGAGLNSSSEIIGKTDFDLPWAVSEADNYRADDFEVIKSGKAKMHIIEMQHQTEGHVIWLDTSKIPIYDSTEHVIGLIGVSTDITDLKQTQEVISAKNKELENYLYIASHDLRSPLVNIQGFSQRLQKQADTIKTALLDCQIDKETKAGIDEITNAGIPKTLNFIFSNVTKMDTLINGLLQISRTGRMAMTIRKVDMNNLFKTIIAAHNFQITELAADVKVEDLTDCFGDENQLNQLFSNIIGNAIKYSDKNRQLVLKIASSTHYNKVIYTIKDTGIGIAPRHIEKIWDVFFRINSEVSQGGEGIGLSLAKRLVDKHKGKIWAESEEGKGSTFFVELQKNEFSE